MPFTVAIGAGLAKAGSGSDPSAAIAGFGENIALWHEAGVEGVNFTTATGINNWFDLGDKRGTGMHFDGVNDYVTFGDLPALELQEFDITFNATAAVAAAAYGYFLTWNGCMVGDTAGWSVRFHTSFKTVELLIIVAGSYVTISGTTAFTDPDEVLLIRVTKVGSTMSLYVNGVLENSGVLAGPVDYSSLYNQTAIGCSFNNTTLHQPQPGWIGNLVALDGNGDLVAKWNGNSHLDTGWIDNGDTGTIKTWFTGSVGSNTFAKYIYPWAAGTPLGACTIKSRWMSQDPTVTTQIIYSYGANAYRAFCTAGTGELKINASTPTGFFPVANQVYEMEIDYDSLGAVTELRIDGVVQTGITAPAGPITGAGLEVGARSGTLCLLGVVERFEVTGPNGVLYEPFGNLETDWIDKSGNGRDPVLAGSPPRALTVGDYWRPENNGTVVGSPTRAVTIGDTWREANDSTQATAGKQPPEVGGAPDFNLAHALVTPATLNMTGPIVVGVVTDIDSDGTNAYILDGDDGTGRLIIGFSGNDWFYYRGTNVVSSTVVTTGVTTVLGVFDDTNSYLEVNGVTVLDSGDGSPGTHTVDGITVGSRYDQLTNFWDGLNDSLLLIHNPADIGIAAAAVRAYLNYRKSQL